MEFNRRSFVTGLLAVGFVGPALAKQLHELDPLSFHRREFELWMRNREADVFSQDIETGGWDDLTPFVKDVEIRLDRGYHDFSTRTAMSYEEPGLMVPGEDFIVAGPIRESITVTTYMPEKVRSAGIDGGKRFYEILNQVMNVWQMGKPHHLHFRDNRLGRLYKANVMMTSVNLCPGDSATLEYTVIQSHKSKSAKSRGSSVRL